MKFPLSRSECPRAGPFANPFSAGFTLVEVIIAMLLSASILGILIASVLNLGRSWDGSEEKRVTVQNTRAGVHLLVRDTRMAGTGFGGRALVTGGVPGNKVYPIEPSSSASGPDTLRLTGSFSGVQTITVADLVTPLQAMAVLQTGDFSVGDLVIVTNGFDANLFEVTTVLVGVLDHSPVSPYNVSEGHEIWPNGGYPSGSKVIQVERVAYWIEESPSGPRLVRKINSEDPVPVAFDIADLQVRFRLADQSIDSNPPDPLLIRSVLVDYVSSAGSGSPSTLRIRIQPRVLAL